MSTLPYYPGLFSYTEIRDNFQYHHHDLTVADNRSRWFQDIMDEKDLPVISGADAITPLSKIDAARLKIMKMQELAHKKKVSEQKKQDFIKGLLG